MGRSLDSPIGIMERGAALFIDVILNSLLVLISLFIFRSESLLFTEQFITFYGIYSVVYNTLVPLFWNGYTLGKRIIGIRIAPVANEKLTLTTLLIRECLAKLILYTSGVIIFQLISANMITSRSDKRAIHDFLAGTYVTSEFPEQ